MTFVVWENKDCVISLCADFKVFDFIVFGSDLGKNLRAPTPKLHPDLGPKSWFPTFAILSL